MAHQWNFYHLQLPNYLAEGVSEYTDALFIEHMQGAKELEKELNSYRSSYQRISQLLNNLKAIRDKGGDINQASKELGLSIEKIEPYWPFSEWGEVAISDPRVFPALYFLKGALALHALRTELGDKTFFQAFMSFFSKHALSGQLTLVDFEKEFERHSGKDLGAFFNHWYHTPGQPSLL